MMFFENRHPLFGIMLQRLASDVRKNLAAARMQTPGAWRYQNKYTLPAPWHSDHSAPC
jgi:hypothetical protein